jgi:hypothetical protein
MPVKTRVVEMAARVFQKVWVGKQLLETSFEPSLFEASIRRTRRRRLVNATWLTVCYEIRDHKVSIHGSYIPHIVCFRALS